MLMLNKLATAGKHLVMQPCGPEILVTTVGLPSKNVGFFMGAILKASFGTARQIRPRRNRNNHDGEVGRDVGRNLRETIEYVQVDMETYDKI
jgi:hypothetical protein